MYWLMRLFGGLFRSHQASEKRAELRRDLKTTCEAQRSLANARRGSDYLLQRDLQELEQQDQKKKGK
ncbi:MAG: hypothetical protein PVJ57_08555 [Phycisphaerae bacterium]|jgi:hypothetical protein